jgi:peptidoglycan/LPS O-acetylase OafA/YrhL
MTINIKLCLLFFSLISNLIFYPRISMKKTDFIEIYSEFRKKWIYNYGQKLIILIFLFILYGRNRMPLVYFLVVAALIYSAHKATRVKGLLNAALWLAGTKLSDFNIGLYFRIPRFSRNRIECRSGAGNSLICLCESVSLVMKKLHRMFLFLIG